MFSLFVKTESFILKNWVLSNQPGESTAIDRPEYLESEYRKNATAKPVLLQLFALIEMSKQRFDRLLETNKKKKKKKLVGR